MSGIVNDNVVFPVIDLIRRELKKRENIDPFNGVPSVNLFRDHPLDDEKVTSAEMSYESGYTVNVYMEFGIKDSSELPDGVSVQDPGYDYYANWRLRSVNITALNPEGYSVSSYDIFLIYDKKGLLTNTRVRRIE